MLPECISVAGNVQLEGNIRARPREGGEVAYQSVCALPDNVNADHRMRVPQEPDNLLRAYGVARAWSQQHQCYLQEARVVLGRDLSKVLAHGAIPRYGVANTRKQLAVDASVQGDLGFPSHATQLLAHRCGMVWTSLRSRKARTT